MNKIKKIVPVVIAVLGLVPCVDGQDIHFSQFFEAPLLEKSFPGGDLYG